MRVAYLTNQSCGEGHRVRGAALERAGTRAGLDVRAFGPATLDQAPPWQPDLVLGDIVWSTLHPHLDAIERYGTARIPAWLLVNGLRPSCFLCSHSAWVIERWARRIAIEPITDDLRGITDHVAPIVAVEPADVAPGPYDEADVIASGLPWPAAPALARARSVTMEAGYNAYWEATYLGFRERVTWRTSRPDRAARVVRGGPMDHNGADDLMAMIVSG